MNGPPKLMSTAAAWRGEELFAAEDWLCELDAVVVDEIDAAVAASSAIELPDLSPGNFRLPRFADQLGEIQRSLEQGSGITLIRGLPIDRYTEQQAARLLFGIASHLGTAVSQSVDGTLVFPVRDERLDDSDPRARGPSSRQRLSYHTDRCDVIAFLCVRQAKSGGENDVVSSVSLYNEMLSRRPDLVEQLMQPYRYQRHNVDGGNELPYYEQPVFSIYGGHFAASLLRVLIERAYAADPFRPMSARQREALDFLEQLADDPALRVSFRQQPGDILLLNNWVTMHRRSEFVDHEAKDQRRLLWRIWLSVPNSRPLDPSFAASYGATEAGAIRGGMRPLG